MEASLEVELPPPNYVGLTTTAPAGWTRAAAATASALHTGLNPKDARPRDASATTACGDAFLFCVRTAGILLL